MVDEWPRGLSRDNLRTLVHYLAEHMDRRLVVFRADTPFRALRPSDTKVAVIASRYPQTPSEIARKLGVTRQAIHASVQRLIEHELITFAAVKGDKREKNILITQTGYEAILFAEQNVRLLEAEFAEVIGSDGVETLRRALLVLLENAARKHGAAAAIMELE
jgi:DNA-binding MarR family transcriptional regulator